MYDTSFGVVEMVNVNKGRLESVMLIIVTCIEIIVNAAVLIVIYVCGCTAGQVRRYTYVLC
jgi:hypothetical protein